MQPLEVQEVTNTFIKKAFIIIVVVLFVHLFNCSFVINICVLRDTKNNLLFVILHIYIYSCFIIALSEFCTSKNISMKFVILSKRL